MRSFVTDTSPMNKNLALVPTDLHYYTPWYAWYPDSAHGPGINAGNDRHEVILKSELPNPNFALEWLQSRQSFFQAPSKDWERGMDLLITQ